MKCKNCNAELPSTAKFCLECGSKIESPCVNSFDSIENDALIKITYQNIRDLLREHLKNDEVELVSVTGASTDNSSVAKAQIENDDSILIQAHSQGKAIVSISLNYRNIGDTVFCFKTGFSFRVRSVDGIIHWGEETKWEYPHYGKKPMYITKEWFADHYIKKGYSLKRIDDVRTDNSNIVDMNVDDDGDIQVVILKNGSVYCKIKYTRTNNRDLMDYTRDVIFRIDVDDNGITLTD